MRLDRLGISLGVTGVFVAGAAFAQSGADHRAVLFDGASFGGAPQPLMSATPNLGAVGFDDRASAIDIRSGSWELCTGRNFEGMCQIMGPGRHRLADFGLDNDVSSLRPAPTDADAAQARPVPVTLHAKKKYRGKAHNVGSDTADLSASSFDDKARSITIRSGVWEVCSEPDFLGTCHYLSASETNLGTLDLSRKVSSLRQVKELKSPDAYAITLYPEKNYRGAYRGIDDDMDSLTGMEFENRTMSVTVHRGEWLVCEKPLFLGRCEILNADQEDLSDMDFERTISSLRQLEIETIPDSPAEGDAPSLRTTNTTEAYDGERTVFFPQPLSNGMRLDQCTDASTCGQAAASAFCREKDYSAAAYFAVRPGLPETAALEGTPVCTSGNCTGLSDVLCLK